MQFNGVVETVFIEGAKLVNGTIADVVVCGQKSRNKRRYKPEALQKAAAQYEGKAVYVNHDPKAVLRSADDRIGQLKGVYWDGERLRAKQLVILESHKMTPKVKEDLERSLGFFGLSHVVDGQYTVDKDGFQVVEQIDKVTSVDLVSDAATCKSLMEQADAEAPNADAAIAEAFGQAVMAVVQDGSLDLKAKMSKIKDILQAQEKLAAKGEAKKEEAPADGAAPPPPASEQALQSLTEQVQQLKTELAALKPKKYLVPAQPTPTVIPAGQANLQEQTQPDVIPTDKTALKRWFHK